ncbi:ATP-dependent dethiobiotin synthetase BioD [Epibacterium sp. SM1979]|uniref:ATP-dependent dethiobiotin synthetase BioD n=1 Tax=Tritonibacter litoralis TaxID=2662264 RepID=A0A843YJT7_9RHOB|nr:dethiobiotin synthase [Tritonibacter litoralis]MQQ09522.1 ATP-dependent dethiobiotin synthetase BioD [Tritonibacter litoralis]
MTSLVITGTDTGIGKTVVAAGLTQALGATYWKPVQSGLEEETDTEVVARLTGQPVLPEAYRLTRPASPHLSAEAEGVEIDPTRLVLPQGNGVFVVEGAGGLLVPLNRQMLYLDLFARWRAPTVLCARTALGTINHSLLSLRALREARVPVVGIVFVGDPDPEVEATICNFGAVTHLGRMPFMETITSDVLASTVASTLDLDRIRQPLEQMP